MDQNRPTSGDFPEEPNPTKLELFKEVEDDVWIAVIPGDPRAEQYLARPLKDYKPRRGNGSRDGPWQKLLFEHGQAEVLARLLNHENLINLVGTIDRHPFTRTQESDKGPGKTELYLVWDFCDAMNLSALFSDNPVNDSSFYLPESLCWHVLRSLSRAVTYLHDGRRLKPGVTLSSSEPPEFVSVDVDWLPILHRAIEPGNIYFQHPRGTETYGQCKLGDFSNATVTGHGIRSAIKSAEHHIRRRDIDESDRIPSYGLSMARTRGHEPITETSKNLEEDPEALEGEARPYTLATELWSIGAVIFTMMTGALLTYCCDECGCAHIERCAAQGCLNNQAHADGCRCLYGGCEHMPKEDCDEPKSSWTPCPPSHHCRMPTINIDTYLSRAKYTKMLRQVVLELLLYDPMAESPGFQTWFQRAQVIENEYQRWKEMTEEGADYRDLEDDLAERSRVARDKAEGGGSSKEKINETYVPGCCYNLEPFSTGRCHQRDPAPLSPLRRPAIGWSIPPRRQSFNLAALPYLPISSRSANNDRRLSLHALKTTASLVLVSASPSPPSPANSSTPQPLPLSFKARAAPFTPQLPSTRARNIASAVDRSLRSQMSHPNHTPPLLLTKRLTAFLHANQTPTLPTLLLTSPHGKLLAHASPQPVSVLRTHATVAASLLAIHSSSSPVLPSSLPGSRTPDPIGSSPPDEDDGGDADDEQLSQSQHQYQNFPKAKPIKPATITVQLSGGTVVIRRLKCGLLFVCVGPAQDTPGDHPPHLHPHDRSGDASHVGSPGEADSMISTGGQTTASLESSTGTGAAAIALRRHAADLSRWLDDKLGTLTVPEEGVGVQ
ncbi:hypothetical protein QQZ08_000078 [Neonectria magnoliae]|uniref:non-specific serine/threonine protein kinase n=1 Tax=Neonectria magnoliae TaxID=2732573 RepID=A0ABR1IJR2_9HYPO